MAQGQPGTAPAATRLWGCALRCGPRGAGPHTSGPLRPPERGRTETLPEPPLINRIRNRTWHEEPRRVDGKRPAHASGQETASKWLMAKGSPGLPAARRSSSPKRSLPARRNYAPRGEGPPGPPPQPRVVSEHRALDTPAPPSTRQARGRPGACGPPTLVSLGPHPHRPEAQARGPWGLLGRAARHPQCPAQRRHDAWMRGGTCGGIHLLTVPKPEAVTVS